MMHSGIISQIIFSFLISSSNGLLCYRCDSQVEADCEFYPAPMSTFEDCNEKMLKSQAELKRAYESSTDPKEETQPLYIRYRYKLCPILERTVMQVVPIDFCKNYTDAETETDSPNAQAPISTSNPMDGVGYVCGKAVTHGPNGIRVRRGCTPDLFLNGTNACVTHSPHGATDTACFCTSDLCNHGSSRYWGKRASSFLYLVLYVTVGRIIETSFCGVPGCN